MKGASVRDLRWPSSGDAQRILALAQQVAQDWSQAWLPASAGWAPNWTVLSTPEEVMAVAMTRQGWTPHVGQRHQGLLWAGWTHRHGEQANRLVRHWAGGSAVGLGAASTAPTDWLQQSASEALQNLDERLLGALSEADAGGHAPDLRPHAGTVLLHEQGLDLWWAIRLPRVEPKPAAALPAASFSATVEHERVRLSARLDEVEIALSDLAQLQVGDVVRFSTPLAGLVGLHVDGASVGPPVAQAHIGQFNQCVALRLVGCDDVSTTAVSP